MRTHIPRKQFSQNFLIDNNIISKIIHSFSLKPGDQVVEIGPGLGALTIPLLANVRPLHVIEIDRDAIQHLNEVVAPLGELIIHQGDVLRFDFRQLPLSKMRIVGNLPYHISTPILFHCLEYRDQVQDMHFMLQNEVVDRMSAEPNTREYGRLTIMVQYHCNVQKLFTVSPNAFHPKPAVDSAIVRLTPFVTKPFVVSDETLFADIVRHAFNHRRKTLRNSLRDLLDVAIMNAIDIDWGRRPEQLSPKEFAELTELVHAQIAQLSSDH